MHDDTAAHYVKREELLSELIKPHSPIFHSQAGAGFDICPENNNINIVIVLYLFFLHTSLTNVMHSISVLYDSLDF